MVLYDHVRNTVGVNVAEVIGSVKFAREDGLHFNLRISRPFLLLVIKRRIKRLSRAGACGRRRRLNGHRRFIGTLIKPAIEVAVKIALEIEALLSRRPLAALTIRLCRLVKACCNA